MKKGISFLCALSLVLAGCSSNEPDTANEEDSGYGYVAVNIVQPSVQPTVRAGETGFEYGSDAENVAKTGLFYIFSEDGQTMYGLPQEIKLSGSGTNTTPQVERIYDGVLVIDGVNVNPTAQAKKIVCVLNAPDALKTDTEIKTIEDLQAKIADYGVSEDGKFIMTNSVYKQDGKTVLAAEVKEDQIATSASEAYKNPVDIYVERVVAKVRVNSAASFTNTEGANPNVDGVAKNLTIKVTGIEVANIAPTSYLFKNINGFTYTWAPDVANKRSYWETTPTWGITEYGNDSYTNIEKESKKLFESGTFDITKVNNLIKYIQPNTTSQKTAILVTAQLMDGDTPFELVYIRGGYTDKPGALHVIANYLATTRNYWKKTTDGDGTTHITQLSQGDFVWKNKENGSLIEGLERYEAVAQLDPNKTFVICDHDGQEITNGVELVNNILKTEDAYRAQVFTEGKCYYYVNIDHTPVTGQTGDNITKFEGVVRNHIYDLTLESIKGIGTPVFDPDDKIIPEKVNNGESFYLSAKVNVLAWKVVSQKINFE